jgi:hypothetical protein
MIKLKRKIRVAICICIVIVCLASTGIFATNFTNPDTTNSNYSRTQALDYIDEYAENPNGSYAYFGGSGGDCTNFVSQVLREGYMADKFDSNYSKYTSALADSYKSWYYVNGTYPNRSTSWTGANQFRYHWANVGGTGYERSYKYTEYTVNSFLLNFDTIRQSIGWGDIIQHVDASTNIAWHSQIVSRTGVPHGGFYDIKVAQHSYEELERSLYDMLSNMQANGEGNEKVCVYRIKKSIY